MNPLHYLLPVIVVTTAHAGELTLEAKPFTISHSLKATALPETLESIRLDAKKWETFEIVTILKHGSTVKKGDSLVIFKTETVDEKLADFKQALAAAELGLAQAELDLATLEKNVPEQLARMERAAKVAAEELAYFQETRMNSTKEEADYDLKRQKQVLASYQEELKQLLKMYEADDITENTEEIILQKQRDAVEYAEFALRMETLNHKRTHSVLVPRELVSLTEKRDDTTLQLSKAKQDLPRSLELKKIEVEKMKVSLKRQREDFAELEKDRKLFEIKAPADGLFYHGSIENGSWVVGEIVKTLVPGGAVPTGKTFASFIPATATLRLESFVTQAEAEALTKDAKGFAILAGREDVLIPVSLSKLSEIPSIQGAYPATFTAEWPKSLSPTPGQSLDVKIISYENDKAIAIPDKAIRLGSKGWTIEVKLADGKTERRSVTRGKSHGELTEILNGAEVGQVVIVP